MTRSLSNEFFVIILSYGIVDEGDYVRFCDLAKSTLTFADNRNCINCDVLN